MSGVQGPASGGTGPVVAWWGIWVLVVSAVAALIAAQTLRTRTYPPESYVILNNAATIAHVGTGSSFRAFNPVRGITLPLAVAAAHTAAPGPRTGPIGAATCNGMMLLCTAAYAAAAWVFLRQFHPAWLCAAGLALLLWTPQVCVHAVTFAEGMPAAALFVWGCAWQVSCRRRGTAGYLWGVPVLATATLLTREAALLGLPVLAAVEFACDRWEGVPSPRLRPLMLRLLVLCVAPAVALVAAFAVVRATFSDDSLASSVGWFLHHLRSEFGENVHGSGTALDPAGFLLGVLKIPGWSERVLLLAGLAAALRSPRRWGVPLALVLTPVALFCLVEGQSQRHLLPYLPAFTVLVLIPLRRIAEHPRPVPRAIVLALVLAHPVGWRGPRWHVRYWDAIRTRDHARRLADWISLHAEGASSIVCWGGYVDVGFAGRPDDILHLQPSALSSRVGRVVEERYACAPGFHPGVRPHAEWPAFGSGRAVRDMLPLAERRVAYILPWTFSRETWITKGVAFELHRFNYRTESRSDHQGSRIYYGPNGLQRAYYEDGALVCLMPEAEVYICGAYLGFARAAGDRLPCPEAPDSVTIVWSEVACVTVEDLLGLP